MSIIQNKETAQYKEASDILSLEKMFGVLNIEPTPMQKKLIYDFDDRRMYWSEINVAASRRQGKTFTVSVIASMEILKPYSSVIIVSKSSKSVSANFNEILKNLKMLGIKPDKLNSNTYSITIGNSHLRCSTYKTVDDLLGMRASLIILDECGVYEYKEFLDQVLSPMRIDYGSYHETSQFVSKILRISSPRTIGSDFHRDFEKGLAPLMERHLHERNDGHINNGIISYQYSIYDSPLVTPDIIEAIKSSTEEIVWRTEYLSEFIHDSNTSVFPQFSKVKHLYKLDEFLNKMETISKGVTYQGFIGVDIGLIDSTAFVIGTILENRLYILETFNSNLMTTDSIARELKRIKEKWSTHPQLKLDFDDGATYIDPSAALTRFDLANDYDIENLAAFNKIKEGINDINILFRDNLIYIPESEGEFISQLELLSYKESAVHSLSATTSGDPFVRVKGHHFDIAHAFRYLTASVKRFWNLPETFVQDMDE